MGFVRRTKVVPARLEDDAVPTYDPYHVLADKSIITRHGSPAFITTELIADKAVTTEKGSPSFVTHDLAAAGFIGDSHFGSAYTQAGSVAGTGYWVYPRPYTRVYGAAASPLGWYNTAYSPGRIDRLTLGSCKVVGSPGGYTLVVVHGDV